MQSLENLMRETSFPQQVIEHLQLVRDVLYLPLGDLGKEIETREGGDRERGERGREIKRERGRKRERETERGREGGRESMY